MFIVNTVRIDEFRKMLENHIFAATVVDPSSFRHALKAETKLQRIALNGDHRFVDLFHEYQQRAIRKANLSDTTKGFKDGPDVIRIYPSADRSIKEPMNVKTAKEVRSSDSLDSFLKFRDRVRKFDWSYYKYPDTERYMKGREEVRELRHIASTAGEVFLGHWKLMCDRNGFIPFPAKR